MLGKLYARIWHLATQEEPMASISDSAASPRFTSFPSKHELLLNVTGLG